MGIVRKGFRPLVEALEDRWVPATLRLVGGDMLISNPFNAGGTTNVKLQAVGTNQFDVFDNGVKLATVTVGGNIFYTGTNVADTFTVQMDANTFSGNLFATMGNSADTVDIFAAGGAIRGSVNIQTGRGDDTVNLNNNGAAAAMTFGGNISFFDLLGNDTLNMGNAAAATAFLGSVTLSGANIVNAGAGSADTVGGNFTSTALQEGFAQNFTFANTFSVNGTTNVRGGNGADTVTFGVNTFNGNAQFLLGNGDDVVNFTPGAAGLTFNGNLTVDFGEGTNQVQFDAGNTFAVGGSMTLRNGNGDFSVDDFNGVVNGSLNVTFGNGGIDFDTSVTAVIGGSFNYRAGNGTNTVGIVNDVGGNVSIFLGNGEGNVVTHAGVAVIGGRFIMRGGNGGSALSSNKLVLASTGSVYRLDVLLGNGDDSVQLSAGVSITGRLDGGGGTNSLDTTGANLLPPLLIANF